MDSDLITPSRSSPESEALDQVVPAANSPSSTNATNAVVSGNSSYSSQLPPLSPRRLSRAVVVSAIAVVAILGIGSSLVFMLAGSHSPKLPSYKPTTSTLPSNSSGKLQLQDVLVNGQLYVNNGLVIAPTVEPGNPTVGQLYLSSVTKQLSYYNGSQFIALGSSTNTNLQGGSTTLQGATAGARGLQGPAGASGGTSTDASTLVSGTLSDNRLSPNVALLNRDSQTFHGRRQAFQNTANDLNAYSIQAADGTPELTVDTVNNTVTTTDLLPRVATRINNGFNTNALFTTVSTSYNDNSSFSALGIDGFVQFVYFDNSYHDIHLVHCTNAACTTLTNIMVASYVNQVDEPSIVVGKDGFARVAYINYNSPNELHFIRCTNADCSTKVDTLIYNPANAGLYNTSIELGSDGFARIVFDDYGQSPKVLNLARCLNADCTSKNVTVVSTSTSGTENNAQAFGQDGFLRIAYLDSNDITVHFVQCPNADCTTPTNTLIDTLTSAFYVSLAIAHDGFARIAYAESGPLKYVQCTNSACTTKNVTILDAGTNYEPSLAIGTNGFARISYGAVNLTQLNYIDCSNDACSGAVPLTIDSINPYPQSMVLGNDGLARIVYGAPGNNIKFAQLNTDTGQPVNIGGSNIGTNSARFGTIYSSAVNTQQMTIQSGQNSTTAFQVQNANGGTIFGVNTTNGSVGIGGASTVDGYELNVSGSVGIGGSPASSSYMLNVNGSVNASTALNVGQNIAAPLTITNSGTTGSTNYVYQVSGVDASGKLLPPPYGIGYTNNGNDTLTNSNFNTVTWTTITGASSYKVYRLRSYSGTYPSLLEGLIGTTSSTTFNDTGLVASGTTPSSAVGSITIGASNAPIVSQGQYVYVPSSTIGTAFKIVDVSNPTSLTLKGVASGTSATAIAVASHYIYTANPTGTMQIFDVNNPSTPNLLSTTNLTFGPNISESADTLVVSGNYVYITVFGTANLLEIFDVSNPSSPVLVGNLSLLSRATLIISGQLAYLGIVTNPLLLEVVNISNPANPVLLGSVQGGGSSSNFSGMAVRGQYLYGWEGSNGNSFNVYDISNPASPKIVTISNLDFPGGASGNGTLSVQGRYAYITTSNGNPGDEESLSTIDISNPAQPFIISNEDIPHGNGSHSLSGNGRFLYVLSDDTLQAHDMGGATIQKLQVDSLNAGTLQADGNAAINGNTGIQGNLYVGQNIGVAGTALFQNSSNSTTAFLIQNTAAANLFLADTSNSNITVSGTVSTFANLTLTNTHFKSTQSTAPTAGIPTTCGISPAGSVTANSTDSAGSFTLSAGNINPSSSCQIVITFNKAYGAAPKSVLVTGASTNASKMNPAVTATNATSFTVVLPQTDTINTAYQFYYWVVE